MNRHVVARRVWLTRYLITRASTEGQLQPETEQNPAPAPIEPAVEPTTAEVVESKPIEQVPRLPIPSNAPPQPEVAVDAANHDVGSQKAKRGRKPLTESQAASIRTRLVAWKDIPEGQRVSLRTLAVELGTSHQLLSFFLKGLNKWQKKDYETRAKAIRDRAEAENRCMTPWEQSQALALERAAFHFMLDGAMAHILKELEEEAETGTLSNHQLKVLRLLAQRGVAMAQKILERHQNNLPPRPAGRR